MSLLTKLRDFFGVKPTNGTQSLRNKPGGLAWINKGADEGDGSIALVNRVVRTVRLSGSDFWEIDPPQWYTLTGPSVDSYGTHGKAGDRSKAMAFRDHCLTPIQGAVTDEEVRDLYAPRLKVPA